MEKLSNLHNEEGIPSYIEITIEYPLKKGKLVKTSDGEKMCWKGGESHMIKICDKTKEAIDYITKEVVKKLEKKNKRVMNDRYRQIEKTGEYYRITEMGKGGKSLIYEVL